MQKALSTVQITEEGALVQVENRSTISISNGSSLFNHEPIEDFSKRLNLSAEFIFPQCHRIELGQRKVKECGRDDMVGNFMQRVCWLAPDLLPEEALAHAVQFMEKNFFTSQPELSKVRTVSSRFARQLKTG